MQNVIKCSRSHSGWFVFSYLNSYASLSLIDYPYLAEYLNSTKIICKYKCWNTTWLWIFLYRVFQELGPKLNENEGLAPCAMLEIVGMPYCWSHSTELLHILFFVWGKFLHLLFICLLDFVLLSLLIFIQHSLVIDLLCVHVYTSMYVLLFVWGYVSLFVPIIRG